MCTYRKEKGKKKVLVVQRQPDTICAPEWGLQGECWEVAEQLSEGEEER